MHYCYSINLHHSRKFNFSIFCGPRFSPVPLHVAAWEEE